VRHRRRAEDEPVERPSGRSRMACARHRDADGWHAVATWAGRDICICRHSAGQRQCTSHDQACEYGHAGSTDAYQNSPLPGPPRRGPRASS
jgi:hypothetical protein